MASGPFDLTGPRASGTHWGDAELHRLRGDLLGRLPSNDCIEVETCFRTALSVAREQGTRGFELRAAVSLARFLIAQGRRDQARELLVPVYGWFTEGFDERGGYRYVRPTATAPHLDSTQLSRGVPVFGMRTDAPKPTAVMALGIGRAKQEAVIRSHDNSATPRVLN